MTALELMDSLGQVDEALLWPALEAPARHRPRRALRAVLIAAAVLALLALAALAASESGLLERFFPKSYDLIAEYVAHVEAVTENDKARLTLHEAVTDGTRTLVIFTVERLDGGSMEGWVLDMEISPYTALGRPLFGGSSATRTIGMEEASARTYLWTNSSTADWELTGVSLRLLGLKKSPGKERLDVGSLTLETALKPCPVRTAERVGDAADKDLVVSIRLSPLSLDILSYRNLAGMTPENAETEDGKIIVNGLSPCRVELLFRDGSRQDVTGRMSHRKWGSDGRSQLLGDFWDLPDVSRVKAVVIDGREYPLTKGVAPGPRQGLGPEAPFLESLRAWTFGDHVPVHPALKAEGGVADLSVDGIWTDGYTTELLLEISAPYDQENEAWWSPVNEGGYLTFNAVDQRGEALAVGVLRGSTVQGLMSLIVECSGKAAQLTVGDGEASLVIPLDMKKLGKLPQIEPKEAMPRQTAAPEEGEAYRQAVYHDLFADVTPDDTGYSAANGVYRLTAVHLYLAEEPGIVRLRAWLEAERLDGEPYEMHGETLRSFEVMGLKDGKEITLNGGMGHQGSVLGGVRFFSVSEDYRYGDFALAEAQGAGVLPAEGLDLEPLDLEGLRFIWTPPEGGRITLDLPMTE